MPFIIADRVRETSTTTGTSNITLAGAVTGYVSFDSVLNTADTTYYTIASLDGFSWEVGIATFTAPSTLARTTVLSSSSGGSIINFGAGVKDVFISLPASKTNVEDQPNIIDVNSSSAALRITQIGAGNALLVEDSANPDVTPFVINSSGSVGIGTATPSSPLHVVGDTRTTSINSGPLAGFRNAIINGNFDFWQRGTSLSNPASGAYTSDRWLTAFNGTGATRTISRQVFTPGQTDVPGEPTAFYRFDQSVAGSGGTFSFISQRIEGVRTFAGQQVTVSFFARGAASLTILAIALVQFFGSGGSPSANVDTSFGGSPVVGTTFTRFSFTVTIPSISGKTLGTGGNDLLELLLLLPVNTTFTFDLASVQIELGPVATPFERRPLGTELALCQRYFETGIAAGPTNNDVFFNSGAVATALYSFTQTKRSTPTISVTDAQGNANRFSGALGGGNNNQTITGGAFATVLSPGAFVTDFASAFAGNRYFFNWQASAEL